MPVLNIDSLRDLDSTTRPNSLALDNLQLIVDAAGDLYPTDGLMVSADGGAAAIWARTHAYADIECSNDGSIHALLMSGRQVVDSWEVNNVWLAVDRVKRHLYGATKSQCGRSIRS